MQPPVIVNPKNGLIEKIPEQRDFVLGGENQTRKVILQSDRDYTKFLPVHETQKRDGFDSYSCVSFSADNSLEILFKRQWGLDINISDRATASMSGTIAGRGNTLTAVADSLRNNGFVDEKDYPWGGRNNSEYLDPVSKQIRDKGKIAALYYDTGYEWVDWGGCDPNELYEGLQYGPLQATVNANAIARGSRVSVTDHAIAIVKAKQNKSFVLLDHYTQQLEEVPWNFYFGSSLLYTVAKRQAFTLVQVFGKPAIYAVAAGGVAMHIVDWDVYMYGQSVGLWDPSAVKVITQGAFDGSYSIGRPIKFGE